MDTYRLRGRAVASGPVTVRQPRGARMSDDESEMMTTYDVGVFAGYTGTRAQVMRSAATWLHRAGIEPTGREPGRAGMNLYPADRVRAARDAMPGKGSPGQTRPTRTRHDQET